MIIDMQGPDPLWDRRLAAYSASSKKGWRSRRKMAEMQRELLHDSLKNSAASVDKQATTTTEEDNDE